MGLAFILIALGALGLVKISELASAGVKVPRDGHPYFGVQLDWGNDSINGYADRIGKTPAVYGRYVKFPLEKGEKDEVDSSIDKLSSNHSMLMLTLEPWGGLGDVNTPSLQDLSVQLEKWNKAGVPVMIRFAHEMNGTWYPWAQKPAEYISTFRKVAEAVHEAPQSSIMWSPNEGGGYQTDDGPYSAKVGSVNFTTMDTNHDGKINMSDDPYGPYYPGDSSVDWVGLSLYHFGTVYPWGENEVPSPGKLSDKIGGNYKTTTDDQTAVPNFYAIYAKGHDKPMAISETGAFYNASRGDGATEFDIKSTWWKQLFDPSLTTKYPKLKMALWFEFAKPEKDTGDAIIDWRVTKDEKILDEFKKSLPSTFTYAPQT